MGFKLPNRVLTMELEEYEGSEVKCRLDIKMKTFFELQELANAESTETIMKAYEIFGDEILIEWNFEQEDGTPLPANGKGMHELSPQISMSLLSNWVQQISKGKESSTNK
jgi:hypothetical protein